MKIPLLITLGICALALPSQALEQRTFKSAKKDGSFEATLTAYDANKKKVTVINEKGKTINFTLGVLSDECQAYILSKESLLKTAKDVTLRFEKSKDPKNDDTTPTGYAIEVNNRGVSPIENVVLKYTLYYRQGDLESGGTVAKTMEGKLSTGKIYESDTLTVQTAKVYLVRKNKPSSGGG